MPGAFNIVPASVIVALEFRAPNEDAFARLDAALIERAQIEAHRFGLGLDIEFLGKPAPTPMSEKARRAFIEGCDILGLAHRPMVSGAGHAAQSLAHLCVVGGRGESFRARVDRVAELRQRREWVVARGAPVCRAKLEGVKFQSDLVAQ